MVGPVNESDMMLLKLIKKDFDTNMSKELNNI